jgi:hypothetical protein
MARAYSIGAMCGFFVHCRGAESAGDALRVAVNIQCRVGTMSLGHAGTGKEANTMSEDTGKQAGEGYGF